MKINHRSRVQRTVLLILMLSLPIAASGEVCQSEDIRAEIACLKRIGISIDKFTEEYLQWVSALQAKLQEFNQESARCSVMRLRYEQNQDLGLLRQVRENCEGPWLEDRLKRFNAIRKQYTETKGRYEEIRKLYDLAKELLDVIEERQQGLEREYGESRRPDR